MDTEIKTRTIRSKQKNGDIYILERKIVYDPEKKNNQVLSTKLIAKIPKGSDTPVSTRPKRPSAKQLQEKNGNLTASRAHVGMMDIIDHIGKSTGIDEDLYAATDKGTAQKIISLARYLLATNGQSLPGILTWQYNHPLPYEEGMTEDVYHELFARVGRDETLQQRFFAGRAGRLSEKDALAYDSTTISTYSDNQIEARYGFNKAGDGLKTIKLLTLYSIENRQPVAFTKQPGNLPDVITVTNAIKQMSALGLKTTELVTDNGYYSEQNLSELCQAGLHFITLAKTSLKWVRSTLDKHMEEFKSITSACPFDTNTHGICIPIMHEFQKKRKYGSQKSGKSAGDMETFRRRICLHLYFNASRQAAEQAAFEQDLLELKALLESGTPVEALSESGQRKVEKYMSVKRNGNRVKVSFDEHACRDAYKYHGYFALVSNREKNPFECLRKYRRRETIESFFEAGKQRADGQRARVWHSDTLRGRMLVQFVALCYYEAYAHEVRRLKSTLGRKTGNAVHDTKANLEAENKLCSWLENTPLYIQLQWFDTVEQVEVSSSLRAKRWSTPVTARDTLFLQKLGLKVN